MAYNLNGDYVLPGFGRVINEFHDVPHCFHKDMLFHCQDRKLMANDQEIWELPFDVTKLQFRDGHVCCIGTGKLWYWSPNHFVTRDCLEDDFDVLVLGRGLAYVISRGKCYTVRSNSIIEEVDPIVWSHIGQYPYYQRTRPPQKIRAHWNGTKIVVQSNEQLEETVVDRVQMYRVWMDMTLFVEPRFGFIACKQCDPDMVYWVHMTQNSILIRTSNGKFFGSLSGPKLTKVPNTIMPIRRPRLTKAARAPA